MDFLNRYFLIGLLGAAVPILIHLLTRDRVRRVAFSTLRFFANVSRNVLRRKRIYEMILLAMRTAACALLAVAFARPFLASGDGGAGALFTPGTARAIVVDLSASMGREGLLTPLREEALTALNSLSEGSDAAALVTFADAPRVEAPFTRRLGEVRAKLEGIAPTHSGTRIAAAVQQADTLLRAVKARAKEVILISDLQRTGWTDFEGDWKLAPGVRLIVRPVQPKEGSGGVAIVEADTPQSVALSRTPRTLAARVANFSRAEARDVEVALSMGGKEVAAQKVSLRPGARMPVRFRHVFDTAGDNPGSIRIKADAAPTGGQEFWFNVRVIPRIPVPILNGRPTTSPMTDAAWFLAKALAPGDDAPFVARSLDAGKALPEELQDARVVILANVGEVAPAIHNALAALLQRGGGLLFLPGDRVDAETFNRSLGDLAPCKLRRIIAPAARADERAEIGIARVDYDHPIFEIFQRPHHGDLSTARFTQFWEVTDSQLSRVLARYDDGRPALLERSIEAGTSMMLTNPADLQWSNLPLRAIFLPLLHQAVRYLAVRTEGRTAFRVGERLPVPEGHTLRGPDGKPVAAADAIAARPGLYSVEANLPQASNPREVRPVFQFAVNCDPA
ncbi:MAG TPA: BatA domain-containing protein, partial [Planctomycetota bacterium]|nr:BatA domain-containing protein [Planctomycetota bacterium]